MSEDSLINSLTPVFNEPVIDGYKGIIEKYAGWSAWLEKHCVTTVGIENEQKNFYGYVEKIESEWMNKPQNFASIDSANGYLMYVSNAINAASDFLEALSVKFMTLKKSEVIHFDKVGFYTFLDFIGAAAFAYSVSDSIYRNDGREVTGNQWWVVLAFLVGFAAIDIALKIPDIIFKPLRARKFDKNNPSIPTWISSEKNRIAEFAARVENAKAEIYADVEHTKKLMRSIKEKMVDGHFEDLRDKRTMMARMEMIKAEMEATIATARNLEEQHRLTEEMRLKYATELIDLERQVKAENNQDLADKLAQVQDILQD